MTTLRAGVKTAMSFDPSKLVTIIVGKVPKQQRFSVHEGIICARSEFFKRAMNGNWVESEKRIIELPEDDPKIFNIYINFLYTGRIVTNTLEEPIDRQDIGKEMRVLGRLYVLGEKLQDKTAKNSAIQGLLEVAEEKDADGFQFQPTVGTIIIIYQGTCAGSLGRRLIVDMWLRISAEFLTQDTRLLPNEFLADLAIALLRYRPDDMPKQATMANISDYMEEMD